VRLTGLSGYHQRFEPTAAQRLRGASTSHWVILTEDTRSIAPLIESGRWHIIKETRGAPLWTDDASNLLPALTAPGDAHAEQR
jgi:hypothetical protein